MFLKSHNREIRKVYEGYIHLKCLSLAGMPTWLHCSKSDPDPSRQEHFFFGIHLCGNLAKNTGHQEWYFELELYTK